MASAAKMGFVKTKGSDTDKGQGGKWIEQYLFY